MIKFFRQWGAGILGSCMILGLALFIVLALHSSYNKFMWECMQDHKQYECRTLYRG